MTKENTSKRVSTDYTSVAAATWAATGIQPEIVNSCDGRPTFDFQFPATPAVINAMEKFELGGLLVDARILLSRRRSLIRFIKGGGACGE